MGNHFLENSMEVFGRYLTRLVLAYTDITQGRRPVMHRLRQVPLRRLIQKIQIRDIPV
jgi:hypothetical protein